MFSIEWETNMTDSRKIRRGYRVDFRFRGKFSSYLSRIFTVFEGIFTKF
jgi:hypothetical protein